MSVKINEQQLQWPQVKRNIAINTSPKIKTKRRAERKEALASLETLELYLGEGACPSCDQGILSAFRNTYIQPEIDEHGEFELPLPKTSFPHPNDWISPWYLWKGLVSPKENTETMDDTTAPEQPDGNLNDDDYGVQIAAQEDDDDNAPGALISEAQAGPNDNDEGQDGPDDDDADTDDSFVIDEEAAQEVDADEEDARTEDLIEEVLGSTGQAVTLEGTGRLRRILAGTNSKYGKDSDYTME